MTTFFDPSALRATYDAALPYDPLRQRHEITEETPQSEITNLVYGVPYFYASGDGPALWDQWRLAGRYLSHCISHKDNAAHYVIRICMLDFKQVCSVLMHESTCIISGPRSVVDLLTVCNTLTKEMIACVPYAGSFYFGSFRNRLHNTVVRLNMGVLPVNFARLEALLRPRNVIRRSDELIAGGGSALNAAVDRIPHYIMTINVPPKANKQKKEKPLIKMYEHKLIDETTGDIRIVPKICINGIPSIDRGKDMLREFYFFVLEHRDQLLFSKAEMIKMKALRSIHEPPPPSIQATRRKRLRSTIGKKK